MKILILCTGNSCRSQMAEGFLKAFDDRLEVFSAGTAPSQQVHPKAVEVMAELGVDLKENYPKSASVFLDTVFDYVITVCGEAKEVCPSFAGGKSKNKLHIGFEDPDAIRGTEAEIMAAFRSIRDEILRDFFKFYTLKIK